MGRTNNYRTELAFAAIALLGGMQLKAADFSSVAPSFTMADLWLPALLLGIGLALLLAEAFVIPGFGIAGVSGILLTVAGLFLGIHTIVTKNGNFNDATGFAISAGGTALGSTIMAAGILWLIPKLPYFRKMVPKDRPVGDAHGEGLPPRHHYIGQSGFARTDLRPAGKAALENGEVVDVVSKGDFIESGAQIYVETVEGPSVIVRKL